MTATELFEQYRGKRIAFITTKNLSYIRNTQELDLLQRYGEEVRIIGSNQNNYFSRLVYVWSRIIFESFSRYDVIFVGFAPQLVCPFFAWKFPVEPHIDFFISLYDIFVNDRKKCRPGGVCARLLKYLDRRTAELARYIVCDTKAQGDYFRDALGARKDREVVLYLRANPKIYYPREANKRRELRKKYVVLYFGSILPLQGVEVILECIKLLRQKKEIYFQIVGPIKEKAEGVSGNVEFIPWLEEEELAGYIAAADLCLAGHFNAEIDKAKRTIPGKAYIYEAMGKPMILGDNPANRELFTEDQRHFFVEMGNAGSLADRIETCFKSMGGVSSKKG